MAIRRWWHSYGLISGVQPWQTDPFESKIVNRQNVYPSDPCTVSRVILDLQACVTVPPGNEDLSAQWWARLNFAYSVTVSDNPDDDPHLVLNTPDPESILHGTLKLTQATPEGNDKYVTVRLETLAEIETRGQRKLPAGGHGPVVQVQVQPMDPDGIMSPFSSPTFDYIFQANMSVLYLLP